MIKLNYLLFLSIYLSSIQAIESVSWNKLNSTNEEMVLNFYGQENEYDLILKKGKLEEDYFTENEITKKNSAKIEALKLIGISSYQIEMKNIKNDSIELVGSYIDKNKKKVFFIELHRKNKDNVFQALGTSKNPIEKQIKNVFKKEFESWVLK